MKRKAIFMDIDGTLMMHGQVTQRVVDAIQAARSEGHLFFLCTGRAMGNMPQSLLNADYLDGYVLGCGMYCEVHGTTVYHDRVRDDVVMEIARYYLANGRECILEGEKGLLALNKVHSNFLTIENLDQLAAVMPEQPMTKITVPGPCRSDDCAFLSRWFTVYDMGGWSDAVSIGVTKATGMQRMLDYLGISREDCIGIGDGANDLPMIEFAGLGVAMGNAPEEVKQAADAVTETCANDGVAVMIERFLLSRD